MAVTCTNLSLFLITLLRKYHQGIEVVLQEKRTSWVSFGGINESGWRQAHANFSTCAVWLLPVRRRPGSYQEQNSSAPCCLMFAGLSRSPPKPAYRQSPFQQSDEQEPGCLSLVPDLPKAHSRDGCALTLVCCPEGEPSSGQNPLSTVISHFFPWRVLGALAACADHRLLPAEILSCSSGQRS